MTGLLGVAMVLAAIALAVVAVGVSIVDPLAGIIAWTLVVLTGHIVKVLDNRRQKSNNA